MSNFNWRVIALNAAFVLSCLLSPLNADDNVQKLPFCNPNDASATSDLILVSTLDGRLTAFSTQDGIKVWHVETQPLLSSNLHHVELTAGGKWVRLVPSLRGTLYSLSGETIEPLPFDAEQLLSSSFKYSDDLVIAGARETLWMGLDAGTGGVIYECGSRGCASEQQTAGAGRAVLVLRRHSNTVRALDPRSGGEKWNFSVAEHQVALSRRECAGAGGPASATAVAVAVALPEGVVAIKRPGERTPLWQQKLDAPVAGMWRLQGGSLQHIDVLWEATQTLVEGGPRVPAPPSLYIGVHNKQLYIQESHMYAQKLETAVSAKPLPWKLVTSRPLLNGGETELSALQDSDPNTLSLITLYGNTRQTGNHGFFLYLQETCDRAIQVSEESIDAPDVPPNVSSQLDDTEHHHVHVHVYSLWFWWKEVLLIAISSALLMNLMIWPRFFAPKTQPPTPLPINQEYIVVERHYERPSSNNVTEYSGRYDNDFTSLRCLGRGGYGVVFEAKNNIDQCSYAVKRITLPRRKSKRERVLREVRVLAKLEHEHIVRYFNAWVETPPPMRQEPRDSERISAPSPLITSTAVPNQPKADSVLLDISKPIEDCVDALDYKLRLAELKEHSAPSPLITSTPVPNQPRADSVLLNISRPIEDCIDALDYELRLAEPKRHRSLSCSDSISILFDETTSKNARCSTKSTSNSVSELWSISSTSVSTKDLPSGEDDDDDSFIMFQESEGEAAAHAQCADNTLDSVKADELHNTGSKQKKGHTRYWSLDMSVNSKLARPTVTTKMYLYIQMQLCRPDSLHDWLRQNRSWESRGDNVKSLFRQIVSAVEYVHLAGLIHRDLKPSNILFAPDGKVKVGDFGLVTAICDGTQDPDAPPTPGAVQTKHTHKVGTHLYMSPEQLLGLPYGFKVDIYSLGLILFELLHPFDTESERVECLRAARERGQYPRQFHRIHPAEVEVLMLMLSADPEQRPSATGVRARAPLFETTDERWHFSLPNLAVE